MKLDRRASLRRFGAFAASGAVALGQPGGGPPSNQLAPVLELVNATEFEAMARLVLTPERSRDFDAVHVIFLTGAT